MSDTVNTITQLSELAVMIPAVKAVRTAIKGSPFVKAETYEYLPHPSQIDKTSPEAKIRYKMYLAGAEFDEFPSQTLTSVMGKLSLESIVFEPTDRLKYLIENVDGDGLSLKGLAKSCARNVLQVKWHVLVTDFKGVTSLDTENVSIADIEKEKPRATIKQYNRESVWDYDFQRINGKLQLSYLVLREQTNSPREGIRYENPTDVVTFLILALDADGNYYQQKLVSAEGNEGGYQESERNYVMVGGAPLKWLPVEFASDEEFEPGELPQDLGYMSSITDLAFARYRVSADYKEAIRNLPPTTHVKGVSNAEWENFEGINGRSYVATGSGAVNIWPSKDVDVEIVGATVQLEGYERYFDRNESTVRAQGGSFSTDDQQQQTATAASINAFDQTARLNNIVSSCEEALKRSVIYCGMFEGIYPADNIEDSLDTFELTFPRDFATAKLTTQEGLMYLQFKREGSISQDEFLRIIHQGGLTVSDIETIAGEIETQPPSLL